MTNWEEAPWLVGIRPAPDGPAVGAGMFTTDGHVVTCAHVVFPDAGNGPADLPDGHTVWVDFRHCGRHEPIPAVVAPGGWHPAGETERTSGDIAVLRLRGHPPPSAAPAPLREIESVTDHPFSVIGFPELHAEGVPARGLITGRAGEHWLALAAETGHGQLLTEGFSGSPVWDLSAGAVVGIAVVADPLHERLGRARTGYAIRARAIADRWPPLAATLHDPPPDAARADAERLAKLLRTSLDSGLLPRVADVSPYDIGVAQSKYGSFDDPLPAYARRSSIDDGLDRLYAEGRRFLLLHGTSTSGKSRSALEFVRRTLGHARLVAPAAEQTAPAALAALTLPTGDDPVVLWLDDLDLYLGPNGLDARVLNHFLRMPGLVVVATIQARQLHAVQAADKTGQVAKAVLSRASRIMVHSDLAEEDRPEAARLYPDDDFSQRGIGEQLVAAAQLEEKYDAGFDGDPAGWAVVRAAVDWRRIGLDQPVPEQRLRELWSRYLVGRAADIDDDSFVAGLRWAREPVAGTVALLQRVSTADGEPGYLAFDYVGSYVAEGRGLDRTGVPASIWDYAARELPPDELLDVAYAALAQDIDEVPLLALERARAGATRAVAAWAAMLLGDHALETGDVPRATDLFTEAVDADLAGVTPLAQVRLASVLVMKGEVEAAEDLLERARQSAEPQVVAMAEASLGGLYFAAGDVDKARQLLEASLAAPTGDPLAPLLSAPLAAGADASGWAARAAGIEGRAPGIGRPGARQPLRKATMDALAAVSVPLAQTNLAAVLLAQGDEDRARAYLESAINSGDQNVAVLARVHLGGWYLEKDDLGRAIEVLEGALGAANVHLLAFVQVTLAGALVAADDPERAIGLLDTAADSPNLDQAAMAADMLGDLLSARDDPDGAIRAYRRAIGLDHPFWSPVAQVDLANALTERDGPGDYQQAADLLRTAVRAANPETAALAHANLGMLLILLDDEAGGRDELASAADSRDGVWLEAELVLARLGLREGTLDEVFGRLTDALDDVDANAPLLPLLRAYLGLSELDTRTAEQHATELDDAADADDPAAFGAASLRIGTSLFTLDRLDAAAQLLLAAIGAGDDDAEAAATAQLGVVRLAQRRLDEAGDLLAEALASGKPEVEPMARRYLGTVHSQQRQTAAAREVLLPLAESTDRLHRPAALLLLGEMAAVDRESGAARQWFTDAVAAADAVHGDPDLPGVLDRARLALADQLTADGEIEQACVELAKVAAADRDLAERARRELTELTGSTPGGTVVNVLPGWAHGAAATDPATVRSVLDLSPDPDGARWSGDDELPPLVQALLGEVASAEGDMAEATRWLRRADQHGNSAVRDRVARTWRAIQDELVREPGAGE